MSSKLRKNKKVNVLVIGQTPPPYGGQAMMIERLVNADFDQIEIYHIRMSFSENFKQVGEGGIRKILHLVYLMVQGIKYRFKYGIKILYYPPAGPNLNPLLRDVLLLAVLRPFFSKTIFHFRAAGLSEFIPELFPPLKYLARLVYHKPSGAIQLSSLNPSDGNYLRCKKLFIIPNGLEDVAVNIITERKSKKSFVQILSVGVLKENKGVLVLLEAVRELKSRNAQDFKVKFMGEFSSDEFEKQVDDLISSYNIEELVEFIGVKSGKGKWDVFKNTDILCFPTFFDSESFGNVILEAMMFEIPVIASKWRGIPDIVQEGYNGLLVPIKNSNILADKMELLIESENERLRLGCNGRKEFKKKYTLAEHLREMERALLIVAKN
ncbi:MAG: glycosyltransferase involved in cell wall biosynthesis [Cyclobacteriaceae bacterium]